MKKLISLFILLIAGLFNTLVLAETININVENSINDYELSGYTLHTISPFRLPFGFGHATHEFQNGVIDFNPNDLNKKYGIEIYLKSAEGNNLQFTIYPSSNIDELNNSTITLEAKENLNIKDEHLYVVTIYNSNSDSIPSNYWFSKQLQRYTKKLPTAPSKSPKKAINTTVNNNTNYNINHIITRTKTGNMGLYMNRLQPILEEAPWLISGGSKTLVVSKKNKARNVRWFFLTLTRESNNSSALLVIRILQPPWRLHNANITLIENDNGEPIPTILNTRNQPIPHHSWFITKFWEDENELNNLYNQEDYSFGNPLSLKVGNLSNRTLEGIGWEPTQFSSPYYYDTVIPANQWGSEFKLITVHPEVPYTITLFLEGREPFSIPLSSICGTSSCTPLDFKNLSLSLKTDKKDNLSYRIFSNGQCLIRGEIYD